MSKQIKNAMATLSRAMKKDPSYAWSWHCNLAMMAADAGAPRLDANNRAADLMKELFGVDIRATKEWKEGRLIDDNLFRQRRIVSLTNDALRSMNKSVYDRALVQVGAAMLVEGLLRNPRFQKAIETQLRKSPKLRPRKRKI